MERALIPPDLVSSPGLFIFGLWPFVLRSHEQCMFSYRTGFWIRSYGRYPATLAGIGGLVGAFNSTGLHTSAFVTSRRAEGIVHEVPQSYQDAVWPTEPNTPGQWWITSTVSVIDPSFEFQRWQATLNPGRLYAVLIQPSTKRGKNYQCPTLD